jgi:hypothetical protein
MSITLSSSATNNADWKTQFQFNDADTGDLIDFHGRDHRDRCEGFRRLPKDQCLDRQRADHDPEYGHFRARRSRLDDGVSVPGSYQIGGVYLLNGETVSLFTGSLSIISGVARL